MTDIMLPHKSQELKDKIIDMLIREEEMISALKDKCSHNFPPALSLKLLRTLISPKFDNLSAARSLSVYIFKNKRDILKKYSLLNIMEDETPNKFGTGRIKAIRSDINSNITDNSPVEDHWFTSNSDTEETISKESIHVTETRVKFSTNDSQALLKNMDEIEETCIKTRQKFFSTSGIFHNYPAFMNISGDNEADPEEVWCSTKHSIEAENSSSGCSTPCPKSRKRKRNYYDFMGDSENLFEDMKEKKMKKGYLHKKLKLESEILKIQKDIEMEKLKQQQFITQIRLMELGIKKKEYHSIKPEESSID